MFSQLGALRLLKRRRPDLMIGVMGCMAQLQKGRIQERAPYVDLVFGSPAIARVGGAGRAGPGGAGTDPRDRREPARQDHRAARRRPAAQGVRHGHGGLREVLHLLCRADHPGPGAQPRPRGHRRGDPRSRRGGLPGGDAARPDRQRLRAGSRPGHRPGRPARAGERRRRHRADPLHDLEPLQPHPAPDPRPARRAQGLRVPAPAAAVRVRSRARADEPRLHAAPATSS